MPKVHRSHIAHTPRTRDAALGRLTRTNRWLIAASTVMTGLLTDIAANAFPGHTAHTNSTVKQARPHAKHKPLAAPARPPANTTPTNEAPASETPQPQSGANETAGSESAPAASSEAASPEPSAAPEAAPSANEPVVSGGS
jgi:hypothetical protein